MEPDLFIFSCFVQSSTVPSIPMSDPDVPTPHSEGNVKYIRLKEAADVMSVGYLWLYKRVAAGRGPEGTIKRGKMYLMPRDEFIKWSRQPNIP